ncbi:hypothetical protein [Streptomyces sp. DT195]|uniref:hypothetical protein n=1 Tax=Streptomyces sp. DT195 TaxID=3393419 RepID=UPI003CE9B81C
MKSTRGLTAARRLAVYGTLSMWLSLTLLEQLQKGTKVNRRVDPLSAVIPNWRFFGPQPAMHDCHLLYRDELEGGEMTAWREVDVIEERRSSHMVWHPNRRREKALFDATEEMKSYVGRERELRILQLTVPYLLLLSYVTHNCDHHAQALRTQFLLANGPGYDEKGPEPLLFFASDIHALSSSRKESHVDLV